MLIPMGHSVNGATRWIRLGFFNFQPAEFVKLAVIISIVAMIMTAGRGINNLKGRLFIIGAIGIIPAGLVYVISSNLSSSIILLGNPLHPFMLFSSLHCIFYDVYSISKA